MTGRATGNRNATPDRAAEQFPAHKAGLYLTHNEHRDTYEAVQDWIEDRERGMDGEVFASEEARARAIATDSVWQLQWYPDTPVGFYIVLAPTLDEILALAKDAS